MSKKIKQRERISFQLEPDLYNSVMTLASSVGMNKSEFMINLLEGVVAGRTKLTRPPEIDKATKELFE